jgi:hypothetical protein
MNVGFEFGVARVGLLRDHGALAEIRGDLDAFEPTQIQALRAVEAKLVAALSDVRSLIDTLEATR